MHRYEAAVLTALKKKRKMSLEDLMSECGLGRDEVLWAIENLSKGEYLDFEKTTTHTAELTQEGKAYAEEQLPEEELLTLLKSKQLKTADLSDKQRIGLQWCLKLGLAVVSAGSVRITPKGKAQGKEADDGVILRRLKKDPNSYDQLEKTSSEQLKRLLSRGLIKLKGRSAIEAIIITQKGVAANANEGSTFIDVVTKGTIASESWKSLPFKKYDIGVSVEKEQIAARHPLRLTINSIKDIYARMGFTEISGPIVEPSFWVFDSLFVPQDHPAREAQDTFHVSNPESMPIVGDDYFTAVRKAHTKSWRSEWSREEAEKTVLSTHATNASVRYIHGFVSKLFEDKDYAPELPIKLFSVGRVFRNENIDFKHLADFYQTDGIIIGKGLTLANLFDTIIKFYGELGFKVRFKPAYFPFVEPGAEIFIYSEQHKEWIEVGGSGIMRAEVTSLPRKKLTVLAWGLGVERILLLQDKGISGINELYNNGVGWLRSRNK
ncbi:MAG: phenylalanine--tRNA ligase subunit alpha [Candidatus Marsarchaeota archaeon]|jgi:phenylalanyl-tRNA synthetase alpha chain|nr:phenylalanine--tRNA ligase subunit alpha [Candidatus Marsarchaeota archaeon]